MKADLNLDQVLRLARVLKPATAPAWHGAGHFLHLHVMGDRLSITAANVELTAQVHLPGGLSDGNVAVVPQELIAALKAVAPSGRGRNRARVSVHADLDRLYLDGPAASVTVDAQDSAPPDPSGLDDEELGIVQVPAGTWLAALRATLPAAGTNQTLPRLCTLHTCTATAGPACWPRPPTGTASTGSASANPTRHRSTWTCPPTRRASRRRSSPPPPTRPTRSRSPPRPIASPGARQPPCSPSAPSLTDYRTWSISSSRPPRPTCTFASMRGRWPSRAPGQTRWPNAANRSASRSPRHRAPSPSRWTAPTMPRCGWPCTCRSPTCADQPPPPP